MRKWIARFSYSLLIVGGVLLYEAYELQNPPSRTPMWEVIVVAIGGVLAIALGARGVRIRHQDMRSDN